MWTYCSAMARMFLSFIPGTQHCAIFQWGNPSLPHLHCALEMRGMGNQESLTGLGQTAYPTRSQWILQDSYLNLACIGGGKQKFISLQNKSSLPYSWGPQLNVKEEGYKPQFLFVAFIRQRELKSSLLWIRKKKQQVNPSPCSNV